MVIGMDHVVETMEPMSPVKKKGISGSTLKMIAIITMFIDHVGAVILERMLMQRMEGVAIVGPRFIMENATLYIADMVLRLIGRLGFPIFCFLLIEGFQHTRNVTKYAVRLLLFAIISELPFDLGFCGKPLHWGYQNVFFTLFIGLLVMIALDYVYKKLENQKVVRIIVYVMVIAIGMVIAEFLKTDYSAIGVLTISVMYLFRHKRMLETGLGCAVLTVLNPMEITSFLMMLPINWYNGERGWNIKWLFYVFYPVHILVLFLIAYAMGLGDVVMR